MNASLEDMAEDVAQVIQQLGGRRAVVLGHAFGNGVAQVLATRHKEIGDGTILASVSTKGATK